MEVNLIAQNPKNDECFGEYIFIHKECADMKLKRLIPSQEYKATCKCGIEVIFKELGQMKIFKSMIDKNSVVLEKQDYYANSDIKLIIN